MQLLYEDIICHELFLHFLNFFKNLNFLNLEAYKKISNFYQIYWKGILFESFCCQKRFNYYKQLGKNSSCILVMLWCEIKAHCIQLGSLWLTIFRYIYTALNHTGLSSSYLFMTISLLCFLKLNLVVAITLLFILNQTKLCS